MRCSRTHLSIGMEDDSSARIVIGTFSHVYIWRQPDCTFIAETLEFLGVPCSHFFTITGLRIGNGDFLSRLGTDLDGFGKRRSIGQVYCNPASLICVSGEYSGRIPDGMTAGTHSEIRAAFGGKWHGVMPRFDEAY